MENYYNFCIQQYNKRHRIPENSKEKNGQKMKHLAAIAAYLINNIPNLIKSSYYESSCPSSFTRGVKYSSSGHLCIFSCYLLTFFLSFIFFFLLTWSIMLRMASSQSNPCLTCVRIQDLLGSQSVALFSSNEKYQWKNSSLHKKQITWSILTIAY